MSCRSLRRSFSSWSMRFCLLCAAISSSMTSFSCCSSLFSSWNSLSVAASSRLVFSICRSTSTLDTLSLSSSDRMRSCCSWLLSDRSWFTRRLSCEIFSLSCSLSSKRLSRTFSSSMIFFSSLWISSSWFVARSSELSLLPKPRAASWRLRRSMMLFCLRSSAIMCLELTTGKLRIRGKRLENCSTKELVLKSAGCTVVTKSVRQFPPSTSGSSEVTFDCLKSIKSESVTSLICESALMMPPNAVMLLLRVGPSRIRSVVGSSAIFSAPGRSMMMKREKRCSS
mmetsp:Transcript_26155/g.64592  ORF Transcript_26155/g.64592 Transcript_26155/m.64592 type:complete len:283 (-) Transcript_26155:811-1659(-)